MVVLVVVVQAGVGKMNVICFSSVTNAALASLIHSAASHTAVMSITCYEVFSLFSFYFLLTPFYSCSWLFRFPFARRAVFRRKE